MTTWHLAPIVSSVVGSLTTTRRRPGRRDGYKTVQLGASRTITRAGGGQIVNLGTPPRAAIRNELCCGYCGYILLVGLIVGWAGFGHLLPPPSPDESANKVASWYVHHAAPLRIGLVISLFFFALLLPFWAAITVQIRRIEGRHTSLSYIQLIGAGALVLEFIFPVIFWAVAAFRPHSDPDTLQHLNDLAWIPWIAVVSTMMVQCIAIGVVILQDQRPTPIFPRWVAYLNFWEAATLFPGAFVVNFKTGPLAWNGVLAFWVVVLGYVIWDVGMTHMLIKAIRRQATDPPDGTLTGVSVTAELADLRLQLARLTAAQERPLPALPRGHGRATVTRVTPRSRS
jgi:hypothetical protein